MPWLVFTILAFNYLYLVWVSLPTTTGLSATQPAPLTCAGCATSHHQTKRTILFVCLPWHSYLLWCGCSLSLSIPHGMHLVVPTQLCFFWVVYHPSMTLTFPYPWGSWVCHQPLTLFAFITLGLLRPILTFPNHIPPMVCFFSLSGLL